MVVWLTGERTTWQWDYYGRLCWSPTHNRGTYIHAYILYVCLTAQCCYTGIAIHVFDLFALPCLSTSLPSCWDVTIEVCIYTGEHSANTHTHTHTQMTVENANVSSVYSIFGCGLFSKGMKCIKVYGVSINCTDSGSEADGRLCDRTWRRTHQQHSE